MPSVTVVIPAYNYAHYLPATIGSILSQTHREFEIIVVDDGSTDATKEVVEAIRDERVRYVWQKNAGLPAARNTGIRNARHELIGLIDADDLWWPQMLERCVQKLMELPTDFVLVACRHDLIDPQGGVLPKKVVSGFDREIRPAEVLLRSRFGSSSVVLRKHALEAAGWFDETLTSSEDRDMWIRIGQRGRLWLMAEVISSVRIHPVSMSRNAERMQRNARRVFTKAYEAGVVPRWKFWWWLRLLAVNHHEAAWMFFDQRLPWRALRETLLSILICPWVWEPSDVFAPFLFRIRSAARFLMFGLVGRKGPGQ